MTLEKQHDHDTLTTFTPFISNKCYGCGKEMCDEDGMSFVGYSLKFYVTDDQSESKKAFCKKQLGKYEPNHPYDFCWECYLDSFRGVNK